jgi:hypothetical protein
LIHIELRKILHKALLARGALGLRIEQGEVVLALLNSPQEDEDTDVVKVLAEEHLPHFFADAGPH